MICFYCGDANPWSADGSHCRGCGRPFAATCPRCDEGVPLGKRLCHGCGLSVEDFGVERARSAVEGYRRRREADRSMVLFVRWQILLGIALMLLSLLCARFEPRARRPLLALGAAVALTALIPTVITLREGRRRQHAIARRRETLDTAQSGD
jgi:hypothetical protein